MLFVTTNLPQKGKFKYAKENAQAYLKTEQLMGTRKHIPLQGLLEDLSNNISSWWRLT